MYGVTIFLVSCAITAFCIGVLAIITQLRRDKLGEWIWELKLEDTRTQDRWKSAVGSEL